MEEFFDKYTVQIAEKYADGSDTLFSGKSVRSLINQMKEEFNNLMDAKTSNIVFIWKEDGSGVDEVQAFFDGEIEVIDINKHYEVLVVEAK